MVDTALVTILDKNEISLGDFEIPIKISVRDFSQKMVEFLKAKDSETYAGLTSVGIKYKNRVLESNETLYENHIWDGSFLTIIY